MYWQRRVVNATPGLKIGSILYHWNSKHECVSHVGAFGFYFTLLARPVWLKMN